MGRYALDISIAHLGNARVGKSNDKVFRFRNGCQRIVFKAIGADQRNSGVFSLLESIFCVFMQEFAQSGKFGSGWLRSKTCAALLETLEHVHWSETENYTVLDAGNHPRPIHALPENTLLALVMAENARRKKYTWLPADPTQEQCEDMAVRVWPVLQALEQPILVQGLYALHNDRGLVAAMESSGAVFEIRCKGRLFRGTYREMAPQPEPTEYSAMRLLMAVNKGLAERPLPYPDEPLPFTPKCGDSRIPAAVNSRVTRLARLFSTWNTSATWLARHSFSEQ